MAIVRLVRSSFSKAGVISHVESGQQKNKNSLLPVRRSFSEGGLSNLAQPLRQQKNKKSLLLVRRSFSEGGPVRRSFSEGGPVRRSSAAKE